MSERDSRTIYVGNLPGDVLENEVEDLFRKYGRIVHIELKTPSRLPGYAFIEYEVSEDAHDAIDGRDGYDFDGFKLRVEISHGGGRNSSHRYTKSYTRGVSRRSEFRVLVTGLPSSASWQDLKDHMRQAGDVCFSQVFKEGNGTTGVVDYTNHDDMRYAIKKLDDSRFRNAFTSAYVRVKEYARRSRSRSVSRDRSLSRDRSNGCKRSKSRSVSPRRNTRNLSRSRSRSRSHSKSTQRYFSRSLSRSRSPLPSRRNYEKSPSHAEGIASRSRYRSKS